MCFCLRFLRSFFLLSAGKYDIIALPVQTVVINDKFRVNGDQPAVLKHGERIDLNSCRIQRKAGAGKLSGNIGNLHL